MTTAQKRNSLRYVLADRGQRPYNLWWGWSRKLNKTLALAGDPALFHWLLLEGDPRVTSFELEAPSYWTDIDDRRIGTRYDATVRYSDGSVAWDEVKAVENPEEVEALDQIRAQRQLADQHGQQYRLITLRDLRPRRERAYNILRMLSCIRAATELSLAASQTQVLSCLLNAPITLGRIRHLDEGDEGLNLAAVFDLALAGRVLMDIDLRPLDDSSLVRLTGER